MCLMPLALALPRQLERCLLVNAVISAFRVVGVPKGGGPNITVTAAGQPVGVNQVRCHAEKSFGNMLPLLHIQK